ncbi:MAG: putative Zn-dependent protease [Cryomorphaceae bacterium]|jgi:predicted Zn-dependent protease
MRVTSALLFACLLMLSAAAFAGSGDDKFEHFTKETPILEDPVVVAYVNKIGQRLAAESTKPNIKYTFTVLDSPQINAFAHEGGYVYINRGLLMYMRSEAQLASVLAHEIAHVTEDHIGRSMRGAMMGELLAIVAGVASRSNEAMDAARQLSAATTKGYGRDRELEADIVGARNMVKVGYDPQAVVEMLSILKDTETFQKKKAADKGAARQTYHGLFSTHPRNDARLRTAVSEAKKAEKGARDPSADPSEFRDIVDGMIWGENFLSKETKPQRYSDMKARVRIDFPEEWPWQKEGDLIVANAPEKLARISLSSRSRTLQSPEEFLHNELNVKSVEQGSNISPSRLKGFSAVIPADGDKTETRIAVIYYKLQAYVSRGEIEPGQDFDEFDKAFTASIETFRTITQREIDGQKPKRIDYVRATATTDFAALAKEHKLGAYGEEELLLLNGLYPNGKPKVGQWIKVIR